VTDSEGKQKRRPHKVLSGKGEIKMETELQANVLSADTVKKAMLSFTGMILHGAFLKLLNAMGRNDMEDYDRIFSLAMIFTVFADCIFLAMCLFKTDAVLGLGGAGKAVSAAVTLGRPYVRTACLEILFFALGSLFQLVIATYVYQADRMICSVVCVVANVVTSVTLVSILPVEISIAGLFRHISFG